MKLLPALIQEIMLPQFQIELTAVKRHEENLVEMFCKADEQSVQLELRQ
jgi:hypothetical protein